MVVCGRGKLGYLTGDLAEPEITHPNYDLWQAENSKERVYELLAGLNNDLDEVKGRIISRSPFPSTEEEIEDIRIEESHAPKRRNC
ncbi:hypothetical protein LIER_25862 [Lithospermum erythrorhizon]|uniref:Uncharacterized protein n=1 Tax=Lithospermum erythrorhizon TaxID=34254 RepID=A0AAV3R7P6_LITER